MVILKAKYKKKPYTENFLTTGGYFKRNSCCVMAINWLKEDDDDEQF